MLRTLAIQNVALIDRAEISFSEGLNVLSGETGAGKSVILDSIDFVLGAKADKTMIRYGQNECFVRAEFSCDGKHISDILSDMDIEADDTVVISRRLNQEGKGGIKINGCAVSATMLRRLTSVLVDVHGQSEHFFLLKESNQLVLLDKIAGKRAEEGKASLGALLDRRKEIVRSLERLGGVESDRNRRLDILRFQIDEIERAAIGEGEEEELTALNIRFRNAEKILEGLSAARNALLGDDGGWSGTDAVTAAKRSLSPLSRYDDRYEELSNRLESALAELTDIGDTVEGCLDELNFDEKERERVENRLDEIKTLKKKYGGSAEEIKRFLLRAQDEYSLLEHSAEQREQLQRELSDCDDGIYETCSKLTAIRKAAAKDFTARVTEELKTLNIGSARFEVEFDGYSREDAEKATHTGLDKLRFLFSANKGEPLKELGKIISGGEMSRFMLAVKAQVSGSIGTCIFDEIDAGIGGKTAQVVAEKFCKISRGTQVIAVSHLARVAAFADRQFLIEKTESGDKTHTQILEVTGDARRREIARLITGDAGELALRQADELLEQASAYKANF